jgi:hypothetical protein
MILAKNRNGGTGLIHAWWDGVRMEWRDMTREEAAGNSAPYHATGQDLAAGEPLVDPNEELF